MARDLKAFVFFCLFLFLLLFGVCKLRECQIRNSYIPEGLGISNVLYAAEDSSVFSSIENEAGIIVYELPEGIAEDIRKGGVGYLAKFHPKSGGSNDWHGDFEQWQSTPIALDKAWLDEKGTTPKISNYLNKYGFGIHIDSQIEDEINSAVSTRGSYFASSPLGMLIVIPETRRVVYAYTG